MTQTAGNFGYTVISSDVINGEMTILMSNINGLDNLYKRVFRSSHSIFDFSIFSSKDRNVLRCAHVIQGHSQDEINKLVAEFSGFWRTKPDHALPGKTAHELESQPLDPEDRVYWEKLQSEAIEKFHLYKNAKE